MKRKERRDFLKRGAFSNCSANFCAQLSMAFEAGKVDPTEHFDADDVFDFPFTADEDSVDFLRRHGRVFFIVRGLPGSKKKVLGEKLRELYPDSKTFWADKVFLDPFAEPWSKESVRESHKICYAKIEKFMRENVPVIINRSSNVRIWEVSLLFRLALRYGYIVVLAETGRRIRTDPALLVHSNSKGLDSKYLTYRGSQWAEAYPLYTGWFLRPVDALYLLRRYVRLGATLLESGWKLPEIAEPECLLFCLGRRCWFGVAAEDRAYCDDKKTKDAYGSKHTLIVFGYAVVDNIAFALVQLDEKQKALLGDPHGDADPLCGAFSTLNLVDWEKTACEVKLEDLIDDTLMEKEAPAESDRPGQIPEDGDVSFVVLGSVTRGSGRRFLYDRRPDEVWKRLSQSLAISTGRIKCTEKRTVAEADVFRAGDAFLAVNNKIVLLESVFAGFYQFYDIPRPPCKFFNGRYGCAKGSACRFPHQRH